MKYVNPTHGGAMGFVLTVNDQQQAMLLHDVRLEFHPSWVEFSRDVRGIRIISVEGAEFSAGVLINLAAWQQLDGVNQVLLVLMKDQMPAEGYELPFINQNYDPGAQHVSA
jgi:hypothetical protein